MKDSVSVTLSEVQWARVSGVLGEWIKTNQWRQRDLPEDFPSIKEIHKVIEGEVKRQVPRLIR